MKKSPPSPNAETFENIRRIQKLQENQAKRRKSIAEYMKQGYSYSVAYKKATTTDKEIQA